MKRCSLIRASNNMKEQKILICDDSKLVRSRLKKVLNELNTDENKVKILEAVDGNESIELYKDNNPALVFMDIVMPNKSGIEVIKEIKSYDSDAIIIMASSVGTKKHLKQALDYGAADFIQKPLNNKKIKDIVKKYLNK